MTALGSLPDTEAMSHTEGVFFSQHIPLFFDYFIYFPLFHDVPWPLEKTNRNVLSRTGLTPFILSILTIPTLTAAK